MDSAGRIGQAEHHAALDRRDAELRATQAERRRAQEACEQMGRRIAVLEQALRIIAGQEQCADNTMSNAAIAAEALGRNAIDAMDEAALAAERCLEAAGIPT